MVHDLPSRQINLQNTNRNKNHESAVARPDMVALSRDSAVWMNFDCEEAAEIFCDDMDEEFVVRGKLSSNVSLCFRSCGSRLVELCLLM